MHCALTRLVLAASCGLMVVACGGSGDTPVQGPDGGMDAGRPEGDTSPVPRTPDAGPQVPDDDVDGPGPAIIVDGQPVTCPGSEPFCSTDGAKRISCRGSIAAVEVCTGKCVDGACGRCSTQADCVSATNSVEITCKCVDGQTVVKTAGDLSTCNSGVCNTPSISSPKDSCKLVCANNGGDGSFVSVSFHAST